MAGRRSASNRIRGPQSALTDFLASNNISAAQIQADYERRQREAQRHDESAAADVANGARSSLSSDGNETSGASKKRRDQEEALAERHRGKGVKKRKKSAKGSAAADNGSGGEYDDAMDMYAKKQPLPGQLENCEKCTKRFTVTPYSKTGSGGGLLCSKCSKEQETLRKKDENFKNKDTKRDRRRQIQSNLLDGIVQIGARHLTEQCLKVVGDNIHDIEEFGDLPPSLLDRLSQLLSKKRLLTRRTLDFFIHTEVDVISLYDCAGLESDDFIKVFAAMPSVRKVDLRCAGQFKDEVMDFLICHQLPITELRLDAANLISRERWIEFFSQCGQRLEALKLNSLGEGLDNEVLIEMSKRCKNLRRLKLRRCSHLGNPALSTLCHLQKLEHLSLSLDTDIDPDTLAHLITNVGPRLRTLSLENIRGQNSKVLDAIRTSCARLVKLRFSGNDLCMDENYRMLFAESVIPPLSSLDLSNNRDIDYEHPDGPEEAVGFASQGFEALMEHSGSSLKRLGIQSCRHISYASLSNVFSGGREYPCLQDIDVSFVPAVDTAQIAAIIKCCPALTKITAFACFNATNVVVPQGLALIGVPDQCAVVQEGTAPTEMAIQASRDRHSPSLGT